MTEIENLQRAADDARRRMAVAVETAPEANARQRPEMKPAPFEHGVVFPPMRWNACDSCGHQTTGKRCFDCYRISDQRQKAKESTMTSIPPAFEWATFSNQLLLERLRGDQVSLVRAQTSVGERVVILVGASGTGKTSLAVAMMREWSDRRGEAALFMPALDLASAIARSRLGLEPPEIAASIVAPLLVLDDLGTEATHLAGAIVETVFHRHAHLRPTILTTWLGDDETRETRGNALAARYGDGFARRVAGDARVIHLGVAR